MNFYIPSPGDLLKVTTPFTIFDQNRISTGPYHALQWKERLIVLATEQTRWNLRNYLLLSADNKCIYNVQLTSQSLYNEFISSTSKLS